MLAHIQAVAGLISCHCEPKTRQSRRFRVFMVATLLFYFSRTATGFALAVTSQSVQQKNLIILVPPPYTFVPEWLLCVDLSNVYIDADHKSAGLESWLRALLIGRH
jgi:hypothetical protein